MLTNTYAINIEGQRRTYIDTVHFLGISVEKWSRVPHDVLRTCLESLHLMLGINYWKLHCAPTIVMDAFTLTERQAQFWEELYTKGLGEFFYRANVDFRGLVRFPFAVSASPAPRTRLATKGVLLLNGGGKDTIVSAEMLAEASIPFDVLIVGSTAIQDAVSRIFGRHMNTIRGHRDPSSLRFAKERRVPLGYPSVSTLTFLGVLTCVLKGYRHLVLSNERSADYGNLEYLGMEVNHQWSKSGEAERLLAAYISEYITPDISPRSLLRDCTEIETTRQFTNYPRYFPYFSSCNGNFFVSRERLVEIAGTRAYWCNKCPKCVFIFACLSAFLPKKEVVQIFGKNLHADAALLPHYRQLLGIEGHKPFECVGSAEEMMVAMHRAYRGGAYRGEPAMRLFEEEILTRNHFFADMESNVLSEKRGAAIRSKFAELR